MGPAPIIEEHLNAAATVEFWLRSYREWQRKLAEAPAATGPAVSPEGYGGHVGHPTESAAVDRADIAPVVEAVRAALRQVPGAVREVIELHYFFGISQRRRKRNTALAHLLQVSEIQNLLTK